MKIALCIGGGVVSGLGLIMLLSYILASVSAPSTLSVLGGLALTVLLIMALTQIGVYAYRWATKSLAEEDHS